MAAPKVDSHSTRIDVLNTTAGRILCVADLRGAISTLNALAAEHDAIAIIHSGDFGFYEVSSLPSISDRTLRHLVTYSSLIPTSFRAQLLNSSPSAMRELLASPPTGSATDGRGTAPFGLSEFPKLLTGELKLDVPVYTVWGACEDVAILEKIRLAAPSVVSVSSGQGSTKALPASNQPGTSYSIPNLTVLDEATTRVLLVGGIRLRLFGLGGAVVAHKLFDNGTGNATIAGGNGTTWTTVLQIGELVDTAQKVYDPSETRLLISHASPGREGLLAQLALVLKADLTVSAGLHFRYGVSYNEFSVLHDPEAFKAKLDFAKRGFAEIWDTVKNQVESVVDDNQKALLQNALAVANRLPSTSNPGAGPQTEESSWKNCWNWNLPDAAFGSLVLDIREGRVGSEMKSQGFNFAYRAKPSAAPVTQPAPLTNSNISAVTITRAPHPPSASIAATSTPAATPPPPPQPSTNNLAIAPASDSTQQNQVAPVNKPNNFPNAFVRGSFPNQNANGPHHRVPSGPHNPNGPPFQRGGPGPRGGHGRGSGGWSSGGSGNVSGGENGPSFGGAGRGRGRGFNQPQQQQGLALPPPASPSGPRPDERKAIAAPPPKDEHKEEPSSASEPKSAEQSANEGATPRQPREPRPKQRQIASKEDANATAESSGGEGVLSPSSGPESFRGRGRGRGRGGRGRGEGRGGFERGRGRGGREGSGGGGENSTGGETPKPATPAPGGGQPSRQQSFTRAGADGLERTW